MSRWPPMLERFLAAKRRQVGDCVLCINPTHLVALTVAEHMRLHKEDSAKARRGLVPWNKGLRASEDQRLAGMVAKSAQTRTGMTGWSLGLTVASDERVARGVKRRTGHEWPADQKRARSELVKTYQRGADGKYSGGRLCGA